MGNISANSLFHFTPKLDFLESILIKGFQPRFSLENISGSSTLDYTDEELAYPMVCFCDIPLSNVENHSRTYGKYAIGLTKEWGITNKISPILYYYKDSPIFDAILNVTKTLKNYEKGKERREMAIDMMKLAIYSKIYEGRFFREGKYAEEKVRFYNEREWRYIPDFKRLADDKVIPTLRKEEFMDDEIREIVNKSISKYCLTFEPGDIKYIIVENEEEILPLTAKLKEIKKKYSYEEIQILTTRIITSNQLIQDF